MNNYQIYEEIGRGKHSTVYKGRKKKTIEYYAIKSVEKSQRSRVLNEVTMLHQLDHPNVLQFFHWYETNNHLWLIVEYCTGADVLSLIKQDGSLPEDTLKTFAFDICKALAYIHSKGIIYCDLKPSNMLVDAHGFLKLSDFGLACHVDDVTPDKRRIGTPCYMAPELFQEGGVPSVCSDFWSLGCVLYEVVVGRPPFTDQKIDSLIHKVVYEDFERPRASRESNDLLEGLLEKDPLDRIDWPELLAHDCWSERKMPTDVQIPQQPAWERYKARRSAEGTGSRREARERRRREVARISAAAQQNYAREQQCATYSERRGRGEGLEADTEVDFGEAEEEDPQPDDDDAQPGMASLPAAADAAAEPPDALPTVAVAEKGDAASTKAAPISGEGTPEPPPCVAGDVNTLLFHASDSHVKPIMCNTRIEKISEAKYDASALPFPAHSFEQVCGMKNAELEAFLTQIYKSIGGHTTIGDKYNNLCYFETLCTDTQTANLFINSSLMVLFVKMVQNKSYPPNLKARLCMVMGLLIRHATYIGPDLAQTGVITHFLALFGDKSVRVRRRAAACLGELFFYVATQQPQDRAPWGVGGAVASGFARALESDDEAVRHYCVKTLENITGHSDSTYSCHFASRDAVTHLSATFLPGDRQARNEHLRTSAVSTLSRLCRVHGPSLLWVLADTGVAALASQLVNAGNTRTLQAVLNILNVLLCKACLRLRRRAADALPPQDDALFASLDVRPPPPQQDASAAAPPPQGPQAEHVFKDDTMPDEECSRFLADVGAHAQTIVHGLMASLEHSSTAIRGKTLLCIHLLTVCDLRHVAMCCECKLFPLLERVQKERDGYLVACFETFRALLVAAAALVVRRLSGQLERREPPAATELLAVALHALTSHAVRAAMTSDELVAGLASCLGAAEPDAAARGEGGEESAVQQCLLMAEAMAQDGAGLRRHHGAVTRRLLPVLARLLSARNGDTRFMSLKIFIDILAHFFGDAEIYPAASTGGGGGGRGECAAQLDSILLSQLFPRLPSLLDDEEPIPLYALKLLNNVCSQNPGFFAPHLAQTPDLVPKLFAFFELEHRNNNVHNVKLIFKVVACDAIPYALAFDLGVVRKLTSVVAYAFENAVETFFEPCMDICHALLYKTMQLGQRWQESGRQDAAAGEEYEARRRHCLPLTHNVELYAMLGVNNEVAETAAHCLLLCAQLYPSVELHSTLVGERARGHLRACLSEHNPTPQATQGREPAPASVSVCRCVLRTLLTVVKPRPAGDAQHPDFAGALRRDDVLILGVRSLTTAAAPAAARSAAAAEVAALAQQVLDLVYT